MAKGCKTGGRAKGSLNKVTAEVKLIARRHGIEAVAALVAIMRQATSDATRIAAIKELLDRAYGKPSSIDDPDDDLAMPQEQRPVYQLVFLKGNEHLTEDKGLPPPLPNPT